jgi:hypothetical protein
LPFKKGFFAAARAFYRKKISAEHFRESWDASPKSLYRTELSSKPFYKGWTWTGPVYTEGGAARNDVINPFYTAELLASLFIKDGHEPDVIKSLYIQQDVMDLMWQHRFELRRDGRGWKYMKWSSQDRLMFLRGVHPGQATL